MNQDKREPTYEEAYQAFVESLEPMADMVERVATAFLTTLTVFVDTWIDLAKKAGLLDTAEDDKR